MAEAAKATTNAVATNKGGRPTKYTEELAGRICEQLAMGHSMRHVSRDASMPAMSTMFKWLREYPEFSEQYAIAKQEATDAMAEDILDIADDGSNDYMERENNDGSTSAAYNGDSVQRSRLRVDTRKWLMAKMKPKKYGERLDLNTEETVIHKYEDMTDEQLEAAIKARQNRNS